jgi:dipeptidyl aminopeptidase/acylaminoacyl peptidase
VIWCDTSTDKWYSHDISTDVTRCISKSIHESFLSAPRDPAFVIFDVPQLSGASGWTESDAAVLLTSCRDVWKVDPQGVLPSVNLTQHETRGRNLELWRLDFRSPYNIPWDETANSIGPDEPVYFSAFDKTTKEAGFLRCNLGVTDRVDEIALDTSMCQFSLTCNNFANEQLPMPPKKAKHANVYLVNRTSEAEFPNLFLTQDFAHFRALTHYAPQKDHNWYSTELVRWNVAEGKESEGILFKPENFDPDKKYPLIILVYQVFSSDLHSFIDPQPTGATINIPEFVSNGYLVFAPNISYTVGHPGRCALDAVVSAVHRLEQFPFVDSNRLGLQGHSFGAFEVNYIVTRTGVFAAAASAAGVSDLVSYYGTALSGQDYEERGQGRVGATLWGSPELFLDESPVLKADHVTTPLLILANPADISVPSTQGQEFFNDLKRLGKKVWLLSYKGESHVLRVPANQRDYDVRLRQFFDHYLKGALPPRWMTGTTPAERQGLSGLEFDSSGKEP